jgi:hypothetical protein
LQTVVGRGYRFVAPLSGDGSVAAASSGSGEELMMISAEELGRAIMAAAGVDPDDPKAPPKLGGES